jgi:hypothetical protein
VEHQFFWPFLPGFSGLEVLIGRCSRFPFTSAVSELQRLRERVRAPSTFRP